MAMTSLIRNIYKYSKMIPTPLKLNLMYKYSKSGSPSDLLTQAKFMRNEIPVRLARMSVKLNELPYGLSNNRYINDVIDLYNNSFDTIMKVSKPNNLDDCEIISDTLYGIKERHSNVHTDVSKGVQEWADIDSSFKNKLDVNYFLDKFYMSRIGIRTLIGQYVSVFNDDDMGVIYNCSPREIIESSIISGQEICDMEYGDSPNININGGENFTFNYIPSHLYYITFELLKNAMKATVEFDIHNMKDIEVYISEGSTDLIIKISDFGGGFSRNNLDKIFSYSYTTTSNTIINDAYPIHHSNYERKPILSGLGYGVPLSKLYCKYFQGDLKIIPYEGIGTDALIFINKIGDKNENIG